MGDFKSSLVLLKIAFDRIEFVRKGMQTSNELKFKMEVEVSLNQSDVYKVTLTLKGTKPDEYDLVISLSGYFEIEGREDLKDETIRTLIDKNAVAILMPYLRSEVTLLTSQPEMESVVLPVFNINKMLDNEKN